MQAGQVAAALRTIAPLEYAAAWDNVGLLVGGDDWEGAPLLLAIDLTEAVLHEALEGGARMIVAYHPPIFEPLPRLSAEVPRQRLILSAARHGIAVYSPHTALDAAPGGVNDWIAECLGGGDVRALEPQQALPRSEECKLVTFCPPEAAERVRNALGTVGAGQIGDYELCSFETRGTGTFFGGPETTPAVGRKGALERLEEVRLEMVCPERALPLALETLRRFHPYEEPPVEIYRLLPRPLRGVGQGRRVVLDEKQALGVLVERIKKRLNVAGVQVALAPEAPRRIQTVGVCAGAGRALRPAATAQGCELFVTGEMRHHDVLAAVADGCTVLLAGHTASERPYLKVLRKKLAAALPELQVSVARRDADPLVPM